MTCLAVNKLTLSLRAYYEMEGQETAFHTEDIPGGTIGGRYMKRRRSWVGTSTFEAVTGRDVFGGNSSSLDDSGTFELSFHVSDHQSGRI